MSKDHKFLPLGVNRLDKILKNILMHSSSLCQSKRPQVFFITVSCSNICLLFIYSMKSLSLAHVAVAVNIIMLCLSCGAGLRNSVALPFTFDQRNKTYLLSIGEAMRR